MKKMIEIAILHYPEAHSASIWGLTDLLQYANQQVLSTDKASIKVTHWRESHGNMIKTWDSHEAVSCSINFIIVPPSFEALCLKRALKIIHSGLNNIIKMVLCFAQFVQGFSHY